MTPWKDVWGWICSCWDPTKRHVLKGAMGTIGSLSSIMIYMSLWFILIHDYIWWIYVGFAVLHPTYLTLVLGVPSPIKSLPWLIWLKVLCIPARLMVSGQPALARETSSVSCSHRCFSPIARENPTRRWRPKSRAKCWGKNGMDWMALGWSIRKSWLPCTSNCGCLWHMSGFLWW